MSHFRSKKLLAAAKDQPCVLCGSVGSTVACHANSVALGKGTGIKVADHYTAWLCRSCHDIVDGRVRWISSHYSSVYATPFDLWQHAFVRTVARWFELSIVVVK